MAFSGRGATYAVAAPHGVSHHVHACRILTKAGGCALLVGAAGVGRRSAATLVAHMHGFHFSSPSVGRSYGLKTFLAELKPVLALAGVQGEEAVLYLEDHHFLDEAVLESVNSLLSSGEGRSLHSNWSMLLSTTCKYAHVRATSFPPLLACRHLCWMLVCVSCSTWNVCARGAGAALESPQGADD